MSQKVQTRANHVRLDPGFHLTLLPGLLILAAWTVYGAVHEPGRVSLTLVCIVLLLIVIALKMRLYALKAQDRVIRLEERLRLAALLQGPEQHQVGQLTESQLIALRFASDAEAPALVDRTVRECLTNKQIKDLIQNWRPDYFRI